MNNHGDNTYKFLLKKKHQGRKSILWNARSLVEAKSEISRLRGIPSEDIDSVWKKV